MACLVVADTAGPLPCHLHDGTLIDMLPDRCNTSIERFMNSLPNKEQITHVACDMWRPYRQAAQRVLPQAKIVVDKFYVLSKANASFDAVRRSIGKADQKKQGAGLKKAHKPSCSPSVLLTWTMSNT